MMDVPFLHTITPFSYFSFDAACWMFDVHLYNCVPHYTISYSCIITKVQLVKGVPKALRVLGFKRQQQQNSVIRETCPLVPCMAGGSVSKSEETYFSTSVPVPLP